MKNYLLLLALCTLMTSCVNILKTADIRTAEARTNSNPDKAKQLIAEMSDAHAVKTWDEMKTYSVVFEDVFYGFVGKQGHPFKEDSVRLNLDYVPSTFDGRITFASGKLTGEQWGYSNYKTYKKKVGKDLRFKKKKNVAFWVPTYQYFIEFPMRIQESTVYEYAGVTEIDGRRCEGVLVSWNSVEPSKEYDQYLIWIDSETKRIANVEYTIREQFKWLTGAASFKDYKVFEGILLPTRMPVTSNVKKKGLLHEMRILDFDRDLVSKNELQPKAFEK